MFYPRNVLKSYWLLGSHSIEEAKKDQRNVYKILGYEFHPKWKNGSSFDDWDMALVTLDRKIQFTEYIRPICLPAPNGEEEFYGKMVTVTGWGKVS